MIYKIRRLFHTYASLLRSCKHSLLAVHAERLLVEKIPPKNFDAGYILYWIAFKDFCHIIQVPGISGKEEAGWAELADDAVGL